MCVCEFVVCVCVCVCVCVVMLSYDDLLADMCVSEVQVRLLLEELVQVTLSSDVHRKSTTSSRTHSPEWNSRMENMLSLRNYIHEPTFSTPPQTPVRRR